ncbi:hypothetical protein RB195_021319 [Necator americanus]|uniref:Protein, SNF2 family n=1 Tax=Necator americanus TaxID=51031 RepID=A0ABR1EAD6_NECAM
MSTSRSFRDFRDKSGFEYLSDDGESVGSHSSHHSDDAAKASDDEVVECSPRSSKESVAEGNESDIAGSDISEGFAVPNVRELPFTSTPRAESAPRAPSWTHEALSPLRYTSGKKSNPDRSRSFIASDDSLAALSPYSSNLAADPNQQGKLRDRLLRKSVSRKHQTEVSERPRPTRIDAGDGQLDPVSIPTNSKDMTPSISEVIEESVANLALSDLDDDIIVLDSDTEDVHVSRKEKAADKDSRDVSAGNIKPVNPQLEPELITIESSSDEEKRSADKDALSPSLSPQVIRQVTPLEKGTSKFKGESISSLENRLKTARNLLSRGLSLPDGGQLLRKQIADIEIELERRKNASPEDRDIIVDKVVDAVDQFLHINPEQFNKRPRKAQRPFARGIQEKALEELHKALLSQPDQNQLAESPEGLTCPLKEHQQSGLSWLRWRESFAPGGGILADEMGLGKTLCMISLIVAAKAERKLRRKEGRDEKDRERKQKIKARGLVPSNATLIVAPAALIYHWESEIKQRCEEGLLRTLIYHSNNRKKLCSNTIARADVVITTYTLLANEVEKGYKKERARPRSPSEKCSPLEEVHWARIILDEAHQIKNKSTKTSRAVCRLEADARWCVTGTPLHNNLWDLYSLMRFLKVEYFGEEKYWKDYVANSTKKSADRLNLLMKTYVLRREKNFISQLSGKPLVELPPKHCEDHMIEFEEGERIAYDIMFQASRQRVQQMLTEEQGEEFQRRKPLKPKVVDARNPFLGTGSNNPDTNFRRMGCMLVMLLRLRQACIHFHLTKNAVDMEAFQSIDVENPLTVQEEAALANMTIDSVVEKESLEDVTFIFKQRFVSAKIKMALEVLESVLEANEKCVIVSQWTSFLTLLEKHIRKRFPDVTCSSITGDVAPADRQSRVNLFNSSRGGIDVMLVSITAGGVGLNLTGGNHLILMDLHWNPALELQASDRVHRMGQTKDVFIHKLIMKDSIEERVLALQKKKMELADSVLRGAVSKKAMNLTLADLRFLFNLDGSSESK